MFCSFAIFFLHSMIRNATNNEFNLREWHPEIYDRIKQQEQRLPKSITITTKRPSLGPQEFSAAHMNSTQEDHSNKSIGSKNIGRGLIKHIHPVPGLIIGVPYRRIDNKDQEKRFSVIPNVCKLVPVKLDDSEEESIDDNSVSKEECKENFVDPTKNSDEILKNLLESKKYESDDDVFYSVEDSESSDQSCLSNLEKKSCEGANRLTETRNRKQNWPVLSKPLNSAQDKESTMEKSKNNDRKEKSNRIRPDELSEDLLELNIDEYNDRNYTIIFDIEFNTSLLVQQFFEQCRILKKTHKSLYLLSQKNPVLADKLLKFGIESFSFPEQSYRTDLASIFVSFMGLEEQIFIFLEEIFENISFVYIKPFLNALGEMRNKLSCAIVATAYIDNKYEKYKSEGNAFAKKMEKFIPRLQTSARIPIHEVFEIFFNGYYVKKLK